MRLGALEAAIDEWEPPSTNHDLAHAVRLRDRFEAKLALGAAAFDASGLWELDHATSATAWLRAHGLTAGDATTLLKTGRLAAAVAPLADAWLDGRLTGGQIKAIAANVSEKTTDLFADHAADLLPTLEPLTVRETGTAMQAWRSRAEALLGGTDDPPEPERSLHLSRTFGGTGELKGSFDSFATSVLETALRVAAIEDDDATGPRTPAERRADALVDVCQHFLDHQGVATTTGRRHRPHLNVVIDLDDLDTNAGGGTTLDGHLLDPDTIRVLLCDANIHRVLTDGASTILDYGRSTRTAPPALFTALTLRDGHCRLVDGCDRGPDWCDAHHVVPWEDGGQTTLDNMVLGCSRHHHLLHRQHWRQHLAPDGTLTITTPDGRTWTTHARGTIPFTLAATA